MLGRDAGKWGSHPNGHAIGLQHQHSLSAQPDIGIANATDVGANAFSYDLQRRPLPGIGEVPVNRQFRLRIETHVVNFSGKQESDLMFLPQRSQRSLRTVKISFACSVCSAVKFNAAIFYRRGQQPASFGVQFLFVRHKISGRAR